ncbi:MAG: hypothetical protein U9N34_11040 [Candidatus Cloacimonadota bacterium]|nr:hypothetical protein [Candidatus Cloacimonadota bacterium]
MKNFKKFYFNNIEILDSTRNGVRVGNNEKNEKNISFTTRVSLQVASDKDILNLVVIAVT